MAEYICFGRYSSMRPRGDCDRCAFQDECHKYGTFVFKESTKQGERLQEEFTMETEELSNLSPGKIVAKI